MTVPTGDIADFVHRTYGLDARHVGLVAGRAHAEAIVHRVDGPDGAYFLKLTPARGMGRRRRSLDISLIRASRR
jgi:hypothetical protein